MNKMDPDQRLYCCKVPRQECQCGDGHSPGVLLQTQETKHKDIILQMAKLLDILEEPAAMFWVVGEYCERFPLHAPRCLKEDDQCILYPGGASQAADCQPVNPVQTKLIT